MNVKKSKALFRILIAGFFIVVITAGALLVFASGDDTTSQAGIQVRQAPINPEYIRYMYRKMAGETMTKFTKDGHALGLMPIPLDPAIFRPEAESPELHPKAALAAVYDLRYSNKLTPVRNQGSCGSCWAFATYGSLESYLMPAAQWNFSENDLINKSKYDWGVCEGGNYLMSAAYLARWAGPVNEAANPYPYYSPNGYLTWKHVQNVYVLADRANSLDNLKIKNAVIKYGAVGVNMCWYDASYRSGTAAYYYNGTENDNGHAVCVVGWDDNYSKTSFATQPAGNGAFIVRNSWGEDWGQSGYFYVSYYDAFFGRRGTYSFSSAFTAEPATNYRTNYGYDDLGWCSTLGINSKPTAWMANIFKAGIAGNVKAVSFYAASKTTYYTITVYTNVTAGKPTSGTKFAKIKSGTLTSLGYQTIPLGFLVPIAAGKNFSVVVKLTTVGYNYPIPIESKISGYSSKATGVKGQSFASTDGKTWYNLLSLGNTNWVNVCLRAFTKY